MLSAGTRRTERCAPFTTWCKPVVPRTCPGHFHQPHILTGRRGAPHDAPGPPCAHRHTSCAPSSLAAVGLLAPGCCRTASHREAEHDRPCEPHDSAARHREVQQPGRLGADPSAVLYGLLLLLLVLPYLMAAAPTRAPTGSPPRSALRRCSPRCCAPSTWVRARTTRLHHLRPCLQPGRRPHARRRAVTPYATG